MNDDPLLKAVRRRLLEDLASGNLPATTGEQHPAAAGGAGGLMGELGGGAQLPPSDDPFDYFVDISRHDLPINPETKKPSGWEKTVHRYRHKKKAG